MFCVISIMIINIILIIYVIMLHYHIMLLQCHTTIILSCCDIHYILLQSSSECLVKGCEDVDHVHVHVAQEPARLVSAADRTGVALSLSLYI